MQTKAFVTLEDVMGMFGSAVVQVLNPTPTLKEPIRDVKILDVMAMESVQHGDLLLAVGLRPGDRGLQLAFRIAREAGALVACKASPGEMDDLLREASASGVVALAVSDEISWDRLHSLVCAAIASSEVTVLDGHAVTFGDLFALSNAAAAVLDGPVIIDNDRMEVIAFSNLSTPIDDIRRRSILHRRPPKEFLDWCHTSGVMAHVRRSMTPVLVEPPEGDRRLVTAIRAGADILGYLWLSETERPFDKHLMGEVSEIARVAALQILRSGINESLERRLRSDLFRSALEGRSSGASLATRVGMDPARPVSLVAFRHAGEKSFEAYSQRGVYDLISLKLETHRRHAAVTILDEYLYVVVPEPEVGSGSELRSLLEEIIGQSARQLGTPLEAVVGGVLGTVDELARGRHQIERLFRMVARTGATGIIALDELRSRSILAEIVDDMAARPELMEGGVAALAEVDATKGTDYVKTLAAVFDCAGDLTSAARRLYLHRNTLKYRLGRIRELFGINLDDPVERLVAELQLRVIVGYGAAPAELSPNGQAPVATSFAVTMAPTPRRSETGVA